MLNVISDVLLNRTYSCRLQCQGEILKGQIPVLGAAVDSSARVHSGNIKAHYLTLKR